ncbi:hypothetical protein ACN47E_000040 [Coniothyrium glycines]
MSERIPAVKLYGELEELDGDKIRLLQIQPLKSDDGALRCTLSTHSLANEPKYCALSYTWGPPYYNIQEVRKLPSPGPYQIFCNGEPINVLENLYDFLYLCATHQNENESLGGLIWVDALCINQADLSERSEQVQLMANIYKKASEVLVWLGIEDPGTAMAFELMRDLYKDSPDVWQDLHPSVVAEDHTNPLLESRKWAALADLFHREWFSRAWIIQEVVLAKAATVICGSQSIPFAAVADVSHFVSTSTWTIFLRDTPPPNLAQTQAVAKSWHNTPTRIRAARRTWLDPTGDRLLLALIRARNYHCQDPRDKVYSALGLGEAKIFPDYEVSVADAYIAAAKYIVEHSDNLFILTCVEGEEFQSKEIPGLPSWVPDWSNNAKTGLGVTGAPQFEAAGQRPTKCNLSFIDGKHILSVEATQVDDIVDVVAPKDELRRNIHESNIWEIISKLEPQYLTGQDKEDVLWRTLMTNRSSEPPHMTKLYPASTTYMQPSFRQWVLWRYAEAAAEPSKFPQSPNETYLPSETEVREARKRYQQDATYRAELAHDASLFDVHYGHALLLRPFLTKKGYFGIGSQSLREGDSLWIVSGCRVPLVLRRVAGTQRYRLVGGTYTHGIMNSELLKREGIKFETLDLE